MVETSSKVVRKLIEFDVLLDVSNGLNQTKIAEKYHIPKSTVSEFFKKKLGRFIKKVGYGTWSLTELGVELLSTRDLVKSNEYFYDDIQLTYQVRIKDAGMFKDGQWKLNKWTTFSAMKFGEWTVRNNNNKSITIIFPKISGQTEIEPISKSYFMADRLIGKITEKYPQIEVINPIPRLKTGSLGNTTLNKLLSPITRNVTVKTPEYSIDNTPIAGTLEMKVRDNPFTAAAKLKETVDFVTSGAYIKEITELKEANKILLTEITGLASVIGTFAKTFREFIETQKEALKK